MLSFHMANITRDVSHEVRCTRLYSSFVDDYFVDDYFVTFQPITETSCRFAIDETHRRSEDPCTTIRSEMDDACIQFILIRQSTTPFAGLSFETRRWSKAKGFKSGSCPASLSAQCMSSLLWLEVTNSYFRPVVLTHQSLSRTKGEKEDCWSTSRYKRPRSF